MKTESPPGHIEKPQDSIREESRPGGLDGLQSKLRRYASARQRSLEMEAYLRTISRKSPSSKDCPPVKEQTMAHRAASKLCSCGEWIKLRHYWTVDQLRLVESNFCQLTKLCALCAIRRGSRNMAVYLERFQFIKAQKPELQAFLVTLTVKNGLDLVERLNHLRKALKRAIGARRQALCGNGRTLTPFAEYAAGIGSIEITNSGKGWHPHVHFIILAEQQPDQQALSDYWLKLTGDSYIVDVRPIDPMQPETGFCEVFKYAMKFQGMSCEKNWQAHKDLQRQRLLISFGEFYGVKIPENLNDEPLEDLPYIDLFFRYLTGSKAYTFIKDQPGQSSGDSEGRGSRSRVRPRHQMDL